MFITGISFFSGLILIVFSIVLYWKKSPLQRVSRFLAATFLLLACWNFSIAYLYSGLSSKSNLLLSFYFPVDLILSLCISPALYFYVRMLFDTNRQYNWKKYLRYHALPVLPPVFFLFYFAFIPADERIAMLLNESFDDSWMVESISKLFYTQSAAYFVCCLFRVRKQREAGYLLEVEKQQTNIRWLMYLVLFALISYSLYISFCQHEDSMRMHVFVQMCLIDSLILYLLVQSVSYTGLSMQGVSAIPLSDETEQETEQEIQYESKLNITETQAQIILQKLSEVLETEQLYLSKKCNLQQLANYSEFSQHHISFAINNYSEYNFNDFINKYRVDHACRLLQSGQQQKLTLEAIGYECGFGSRANFFKTFKRFTGKTPAEYLAIQQAMSTSVNPGK